MVARMSRIMLCGNGTKVGEYWECQIVVRLPSSTFAALPFSRVVSWSLAATVQPVRVSAAGAGAGGGGWGGACFRDEVELGGAGPGAAVSCFRDRGQSHETCRHQGESRRLFQRVVGPGSRCDCGSPVRAIRAGMDLKTADSPI